jgi:hypothetical protein
MKQMAENIANTIARQLFAMAAKKRDTNLVQSMRDEKYQRTFTDEFYPPRARPGFKPLSPEQKREWEMKACEDEK